MDYYRSFTGQDTATFRKLYGYKKLLAWQAADELAGAIHFLVIKFPRTYERLRGQMLASSGSAPDNIAEGYCRNALGDYIRFCEIARGSLGELGSQIQRCERWKLLQGESLQQLLRLYSDATYHLEQLIKSLRKKRKEGSWDRSMGIHEERARYETTEPASTVQLPEEIEQTLAEFP